MKKKDYENLTSSNIEKVIALLNPGSDTDKPITKKQACDVLNIAYNTARLQKIIEEYEDRKAYTKKRKKSLRGRPASTQEIAEACSSFLGGDTLTDIAKRLFRSAHYHSTVIVKDRLTPEYVNSKPGMASFDYESKYGCPCYSIYVVQKVDSEDTFFSNVESGGFNAYAPAYELGKLTHLEKYGINLERL